MFRRKTPLRPLQKLRESFWPSIGWKRATLYVWRRVWRLTGTPHAIAMGTAAGAFAACTPFLGFHFMIAVLLAWVFRGNLLASAFGTMIGNPLSYPPIWYATYDIGNRILGTHGRHHVDLASTLMSHKAFDMILPVLLPMSVGCVPVGIGTAAVTYFIVREAVDTYQKRRRDRLAERAEARLAAMREESGEGVRREEHEEYGQ
ncbi:MAG TPA: DUF2062 domain-containing protein [Parvibaculum sp.]